MACTLQVDGQLKRARRGNSSTWACRIWLLDCSARGLRLYSHAEVPVRTRVRSVLPRTQKPDAQKFIRQRNISSISFRFIAEVREIISNGFRTMDEMISRSDLRNPHPIFGKSGNHPFVGDFGTAPFRSTPLLMLLRRPPLNCAACPQEHGLKPSDHIAEESSSKHWWMLRPWFCTPY